MPDPPAALTPSERDELVRTARAARAASWSPYSGVRVGAALLCADGRLVRGTNVENASYGLTICAERSAAVAAVSAGATAFRALAVASDRGHALMPCGACRQFLAEFGIDLTVLVCGSGDEVVETSLAELLPRAFGARDLES